MKVSEIRAAELIGLLCEVKTAENESQVGISGKIVDETLKTIVISVKDEKKRIPKKGTIFRIIFDGKKIDVDGDYLALRPEDRIKKVFRKW